MLSVKSCYRLPRNSGCGHAVKMSRTPQGEAIRVAAVVTRCAALMRDELRLIRSSFLSRVEHRSTEPKVGGSSPPGCTATTSINPTSSLRVPNGARMPKEASRAFDGVGFMVVKQAAGAGWVVAVQSSLTRLPSPLTILKQLLNCKAW